MDGRNGRSCRCSRVQLFRQLSKQEIKHLQSRRHHLRQFRRLKQFQSQSMIHRRNQLHLQGVLTLQSKNGQLNFNFQPERLVLVQNQKSIRCRYVMNDGQWTAEEHEAHLYKAGQAQNVYAWNREARAEAERHNREYCSKHGRLERPCPAMEASKHIQLCLMVHLQKVFHLCEFFQMSMMLYVSMIHLRLRHRSQYFRRKPLQQQAEEASRVLLRQGASKDWFRTGPASYHLQSFHLSTPAHPPRPPIEALPKPAQQNPATLKRPLPHPAQQGPPNKQVIRHFQVNSSSLSSRPLWQHHRS